MLGLYRRLPLVPLEFVRRVRMSRSTPVWGILGMLAIAGLLILAAQGCTPAAEPSAAPTSTAASAAAKPAASAEWKVEWDKVLAAAKKEGKVAVVGPPGDNYRNAAREFQKAHPEIPLEYIGMQGREIEAKLLTEQQAGLYNWDVYYGGPGTQIKSLLPNGALDPLRPAMMLPEVLDDSKWHQGFDDGWFDRDHQYLYAFLGYLSPAMVVNRKIAPKSELRGIDDLLDPKWKGKIAWQDPRLTGAGSLHVANLLKVKGEDWLRKLLANDIVVQTDSRGMVEGLIRGRYAVAIGYRKDDLVTFEREGLTDDIEKLEPDTAAGATITPGSGVVALIKNQPHPNAAKVFTNWLLSKEGQKAQVSATQNNSRRLDVEGPADSAPRPGVTYVSIQKEETTVIVDEAIKIAKEVIK